MIRYAKHINIDYIIIDSTIQVDGETIPIQVQVNVQNVKEKDRSKIFRIVNVAFHRNISFDQPRNLPKKLWWKFW